MISEDTPVTKDAFAKEKFGITDSQLNKDLELHAAVKENPELAKEKSKTKAIISGLCGF